MIDKEKEFLIADITVHPRTDEISSNGVTVEIKSMAMKLLCFFAEHPEKVISRDCLRDNLWQDNSTSDHTINNHMYNLRKIFASLDGETKFFHTVTGSQSGYRLLAPVRQEASSAKEANKALITSDINNSKLAIKTAGPSQFSKKSLKSNRLLNIMIFVLVLSVGLVVFFDSLSTKEPNNLEHQVPLTFREGREQNPAISEDGEVVLYANRTDRGSTWELYAARLSENAELIDDTKVFSATVNNDNYVSISPNKKHIAFIRYPLNKRGIYLADFDEHSLTASNERLVIPLTTVNLSPSISWLNDREFFYNASEAISAPRKVFKYDLVSSNSEPISAPPLNTFGDFAVVTSPNRQWLAIMRADESNGYQLFLYDLIKKLLIETPVKNDDERLRVSFSDDSKRVFFINQQGYLSEYYIEAQSSNVISSLAYPGYWPLKIPNREGFLIQDDWGLSSLTNRIIRISNPLAGGDSSRTVVVDNGLSTRAVTSAGEEGLIFASVTANQKVEIWRYHQGKAFKLDAFNNMPRYKAALSFDWPSKGDKALLSINNTCHLIDINTGKDSPLCPANESLFAGRFSKDGQSIYLVGGNNRDFAAIKMGMSGYPLSDVPQLNDINSIHEGLPSQFYYSEEPSYDIYRYDANTGVKEKLIERTFVIERFSNNDFAVTPDGIYFMDRKQVKQNAIYFYDFADKKITFVASSKDNYPHFVLSSDSKYIYLIQSYDNNSKLSLIK